MTRPTRKHATVGRFDSPEGREMFDSLETALGAVDVEAVDREGPVHLFRLSGPLGFGLLAESDGADPDRPGVRVTTCSAWIRRAALAGGGSWVMDGRFHRWRAIAPAMPTSQVEDAANAPGGELDDTPRAATRIAVRLALTAEVAHDDTFLLGEVPPGAVPGLMAGLTPDHVRELAHRFVPELP